MTGMTGTWSDSNYAVLFLEYLAGKSFVMLLIIRST